MMKSPFNKCISLFDKLYVQLDKSNAKEFNRDAGIEVRKRLQQLNFLIDKVYELQIEGAGIQHRHGIAFSSYMEYASANNVDITKVKVPDEIYMSPKEVKRLNEICFELEVNTESFYYLAGRLRALLKHGFTVLKNFEAVGVRNVRNKLLEHTEGNDSKISIVSFAWGNSCGPVVRAIRYKEQLDVFPDGGLFLNAEEFRVNFELIVMRKLEE